MSRVWRASVLLLVLACGCRSTSQGVTFSFDPLQDLFWPDERPLHERYPANRPISAGKAPRGWH